jgi:hypothetical protein
VDGSKRSYAVFGNVLGPKPFRRFLLILEKIWMLIFECHAARLHLKVRLPVYQICAYLPGYAPVV